MLGLTGKECVAQADRNRRGSLARWHAPRLTEAGKSFTPETGELGSWVSWAPGTKVYSYGKGISTGTTTRYSGAPRALGTVGQVWALGPLAGTVWVICAETSYPQLLKVRDLGAAWRSDLDQLAIAL